MKRWRRRTQRAHAEEEQSEEHPQPEGTTLIHTLSCGGIQSEMSRRAREEQTDHVDGHHPDNDPRDRKRDPKQTERRMKWEGDRQKTLEPPKKDPEADDH